MKGNAKIVKTTLGMDCGVLTCTLRLEQGSDSQGFSGNGSAFIQKVLETVGVNWWEDLVGQYVRVDGENAGEIYGIGHITEDRWFYPKLAFLSFSPTEQRKIFDVHELHLKLHEAFKKTKTYKKAMKKIEKEEHDES